jgi:hypothetical protein
LSNFTWAFLPLRKKERKTPTNGFPVVPRTGNTRRAKLPTKKSNYNQEAKCNTNKSGGENKKKQKEIA